MIVYICIGMIVCFVCGLIVGVVLTSKKLGKEITALQEIAEKHLGMFHLMHKWLKTKREGKHIKNYFIDNGYQTIAIYGMSYIGQCLLEELKDSEIKVEYAIDRIRKMEDEQVNIISPDEELPEVDVIVVTAISYFYDIHEMLLEKTNITIVSLTDILFEL